MCEGDDVMLDAEPLVLYGAVDNGDENEGPGYSRPVAAIISRLDCSPLPLVNVQNLQDCQGHH